MQVSTSAGEYKVRVSAVSAGECEASVGECILVQGEYNVSAR